MRSRIVIAIIAAASMLTACATRNVARIEVTPAVAWVFTDNTGRHESTNRYAPFVVSQGVPFTMDFARRDSFASPDTQKVEQYFDGVVAHLRIVVSNTMVCFSGRADYQLHLGVTSSYSEDDESLYGQTLRSYSTRFSGTSTFGHEMRVGAGEDIESNPVVLFTFRETGAPLREFSPVILDDVIDMNRCPNNGAVANRRPAGQLSGSNDLSAIGAADRAFPATVTELGR